MVWHILDTQPVIMNDLKTCILLVTEYELTTAYGCSIHVKAVYGSLCGTSPMHHCEVLTEDVSHRRRIIEMYVEQNGLKDKALQELSTLTLLHIVKT